MEKFYKKFAFNFSDVGMALLILISLLFNANVNAQAPTFTSTPVTNAIAGTPYNYSLFATDPGNNNITFTAPTLPSWLTFSASGQNVATEFANIGGGEVGGVAGDADGNIYATPLNINKVYKIAPDGTKTEWATRVVGSCFGMLVHGGYLYMSYYGNSRIDRIPLNNPSAGASTFVNIGSPLAMIERDGNIYVASHSPGKIFKIDLSNNNSISTYATVNSNIFGLGFDKQNDLLIAGWSPSALYKWNGSAISTLQSYTNNVSDVKVDAAGYVYVSLMGGGVRKYTPDLSSYVAVHANSSAWGMALTPTGALVFGNSDGKVYRIQTGAVLTGTPTQAHIGTHNVKITANNGTQIADQEFTITVKGLPTIGSFANISKSVGDANFSLTAPTSNSNGAFSYTSSNAGVATISGSTVTITGVGTTTITATQAADGLYTESSVTATLTVGIKPPGNALTFDGSGDFVQIGNANTFDARNMKTIEAWVKFNDLVNEQEIISKSTSSNGLELIIYDRKLAVFAMGGGGPDKNVSYPTSNLVANRWYHVAATHNGANSTLTLYLNGVVIGTTQTPAGMTNSPDPLHLGKWNNSQGNRYFTGSLDEVRIWNVQRTQAQIQAGMYQEMDPATAGLQAYYKFSEGIADGNNVAVTTTLDATANANNGTLNGFTKTGSLSNYTESYAMVVPVLQDATEVTGEGFTAKWETPVTGIVNGYLLDVSESSTFASFVTGYQNKDVGNVNEFAVTGLAANKTYYIRVRANKTSVNTQGTYSNVKTAATTKSNQTITFNDLAAKTYGDANFTLSATSTSNLTVTFESSDETIASVSGTTVTIKKAGTVNIIAKQAGNNLYNAASNVSKSLVINQASLTVTAQDATKTYDKIAYSGGNNVTYTGFVSGDNAANSVTGTVVYAGTSQGAINVANNYSIIPSGLSSANYAITYVNGTLTINKATLTVTAQNATKIYDKVAYNGGNGIAYAGFVTGDNAANSVTGTVVYAGTSQGAINVANNYSIIPSGLSSANYAITYGNGTLTINKATLTVTAQNATKTYDKVAYTGGNNVTYTGFITGDNAANSVTGTVSYGGTSQGAVTVNNYTIIPSGLSSANYSITYVNGSLTINKATLTVTAQNATKIYDKVAYTGGNGISYAGFITGDNAANSVTGTVSYGGTSQGAVTVNNYTIIPSGLSSANYSITYVNGSLTINKAALTVTAQNATKIYDKVAYNGGNGIDYAGFVTGDNATNSVTGTVSYGGTSQGAIAVNNYTIIPSGLSSANYAITYVNGALTINKATLTVTAQNATKTYDKVAYNGGNGIAYAGFVAGDNASNSVTGTISYGGTAQGAITANTYTIIPSGLSSTNYAINYVNGTLTINKAALTVTAQNATKTYNGLGYTGGNGVSYAGFIAGDNETNNVTGTLTYGGTSQNAVNVNSYVITPAGLSSSNYSISYVNGTLTVNKAALVAIAENKARCFGLANPTFTVRYTGFVNNETASVLTTAPVVSTTATTNSAAGNYTLAVAGGAAANYTLTYQNGQLTVYALPVIHIEAGKTSISRGDQIQLVASGGTSYSWANANGIIAGQNGATLTIRPSLTTTYQVTVTNANGCTDTKSFTIEVVEDFKITGTNLLTPNGDGYNDFFVLENIDLYPNNVVKIFDKAGRLVYSKVRYDNTWDGTFNGAPLAEGTYYYIVDFGKGNAVKKGFISIVRNGK